MKNKVLFISNDASISGAPIVLLHLLKRIKELGIFEFELVTLQGGPLKTEFSNVCKTYSGNLSLLYRVFNKLTLMLFKKQLVFFFVRKKSAFKLIFGSTVLTMPSLVFFKKKYKSVTVCNIHEMQHSCDMLLTLDYIRTIIGYVDHFIAGASPVEEMLVNTFGIDAAKVSKIHSFIMKDKIDTALKNNDENMSAFYREGVFNIVCSGSIVWRKGPDLMLPFCMTLIRKYPQFKFQLNWIGFNPKSQGAKDLEYDIKLSGLEKHINLIAPYPDSFKIVNKQDCYLLFSREDPFPQAALEAAYLQKPVLAFKKAGGISDLLENGRGILCDYLDTESMATAVYELAMDKEKARAIGRILHNEVVNEYEGNVVAPKLINKIKTLFDNHN